MAYDTKQVAVANSSSIKTLQSNISTISEGLDSLQNAVSDHESRISALEEPNPSTTENS